MRIILASQSLYRKHALDILGIKYDTIPSNIDEKSIRNDNPRRMAEFLSQAKAIKIGGENPNSVVIAADLFNVLDDKIVEKPINLDDAAQMLKNFSGQTFEIIAGLTVYNSDTKKILTASETCSVKFRKLTDFEITDYISHYPVLKCAGAFESDGLLRFSEHIKGSYNFRTGLPMNRLIEFLRENEIKV